MKNNKGFTLVELLATITILAIIASITLYIALGVIKSAKEKTYETTKVNVTSNVSSYLLERGKELSFVKASDGLIEYQCVLVKNLVDLGYLDNKVMDAKVSEDRNVMLDDYIYVERDTTTKAITKSIYIVDSNSTYGNVCGAVARLGGMIEFSFNPKADVWSQSKEVTIKYHIKYINDINTFGDYQYTYAFKDEEDNQVASDSKTFNDYYMTNGFTASVKGSVNAKIVRNDGVAVATGTHRISNIDRTGPVVTLVDNPTGYLYSSATVVLNVVDSESGVDYSSFTKDDIEISIGGTKIKTFSLTRSGNSGNYNLKIDDTTNYGGVIITVKGNSVFDNAGNPYGGDNFPLSAEWRKVAQIPTAVGYCSNPTYDGTEKVIVKTAGTGYTWTAGTVRTNAGSQNVTASLSTGYIWSDGATTTKTISCEVLKADATCPTLTNYSGTYDGSRHTITVSGGSGGTIKYRTSSTGTWSTTKPTRTSAGTTTVYVEVEGDSNHNTVNCYRTGTTNATITISKKEVTVTATDKSMNYGSSAPAYSYTTTGVISGDTAVSGTATYTVKNSSGTTVTVGSSLNVGTYTITPSGLTAGDNYTIKYANGTLTVNKVNATCPTLANYSGTYDGGRHTITVSGGSGGTIKYRRSSTGTWTTTNPSRTSVGETTVYVEVEGDDNHNTVNCYRTGTTNATITISAKEVTVTAANKSMNYGGSAPTYSYTTTGAISGDTAVSGTATYTVKNSSGTTVTVGSSLAAGTYTITPSGLTAGDNYTIKYANGTLTVNKVNATCPTLTDYSGTYDKSSHTITVSGGSGGTIKYRTSSTGAWSTTKPSSTNAGTTTVYVEVEGDDNHNTVNCYRTGTTNAKITISKKEVTVTAANKSMNFGGSAPAYTYTTDGVISGDTAVSGTATYTVKNSSGTTVTVGSSLGAGTYTITPSGLTAASNYTIKYVNGTLTVNKVAAVITCANKEYTGSAQIIATCAGGTVGNASQTNVGNYTITCTGDNNHTNAANATCSITQPSDSFPTTTSCSDCIVTGSVNCKGTNHTITFCGTTTNNKAFTCYKTGDVQKADVCEGSTTYTCDGVRLTYSGYTIKRTISTCEKKTCCNYDCSSCAEMFTCQSPYTKSYSSCLPASSGGGGCFLAGTKVKTVYGFKDIEKIVVGDMVLSYNEETGKNEYKRVDKLFVHKDNTENLYSLTIDGKLLKVTEAHRFYINRDNKELWLTASELQVGDMVRYANGTYHKITKISYSLETNTVYNFSVVDNHNYYVTNDMILVHNVKSDLNP